MKLFFKKLLLGKNPTDHTPLPVGAVEKRVQNIKAIWNNEHGDDIGIEKLLRLFLALSQFVFLGTYVKQISGKKGQSYHDLAVDAYVLFKVAFPLAILLLGMQSNRLVVGLVIWSIAETMLYVPTLIFASDLFPRPRSYRRSILLLFINYLEVVLSFGVLYSSGNYLNQPLTYWFDPVYFSLITSATIGYGDLYPVTTTGRVLVSCQSVIFSIFVVLFLNYFSNRVESKGYFGHQKSGQ